MAVALYPLYPGLAGEEHLWPCGRKAIRRKQKGTCSQPIGEEDCKERPIVAMRALFTGGGYIVILQRLTRKRLTRRGLPLLAVAALLTGPLVAKAQATAPAATSATTQAAEIGGVALPAVNPAH